MLLIELLGPSCNSSSLPVDRKYQKRQSRDNYIILLGTDHLTCRGGGGGGLWVFFRSEIFFSDNTRVRIYILNFFPTM